MLTEEIRCDCVAFGMSRGSKTSVQYLLILEMQVDYIEYV